MGFIVFESILAGQSIDLLLIYHYMPMGRYRDNKLDAKIPPKAPAAEPPQKFVLAHAAGTIFVALFGKGISLDGWLLAAVEPIETKR